jgi:hypothetical protein
MTFDPRVNGEYLRKRFGEAIWESPLMYHVDADEVDPLVDALVDRLLIEMGAE